MLQGCRYYNVQISYINGSIEVRKQSPGVIKAFSLTSRVKERNQSPGVIKVFRMSSCALFSLPSREKVQKQSPGVMKVFRMSSYTYFPHMLFKSTKERERERCKPWDHFQPLYSPYIPSTLNSYNFLFKRGYFWA